MILISIVSVVAILLSCLGIYKLASKHSGKSIADVSDANYLLQTDIDISRKTALYLQHNMQEMKESMELLQQQCESLQNKQYDLQNYQKENLIKWTNEVKN